MFKVVKSHWKHWQNVQKLYCGRGLSLHVLLPQKQIYGFKKAGGRWGCREIYWLNYVFQNQNLTILTLGRTIGYVNMQQFDKIFDIREEYCLYIQNIYI